MSPSELMPFGPHYQRIKQRMKGRRLLRKTRRRLFGVLERYGIYNVPRLALAIFVGGLFIVSFFTAIFSIGLPNPARLTIYAATESTKVFDRNGVVLSDIYNEKRRTTVAFDEIPEMMKQATIAIEDKDFYHHGGFDIKGLLRGLILKPLTGRGFQGGSTITQQFVKNALLSSQRTVARKIRELILSFELEQVYSKDKILELYLNEIPYGNSAYGVQAAAQTYFGKDIEDITLPEAAVLAALPQAPSRYSPYGQNPDLLMARKDAVLTAMYKQGYITGEEEQTAAASEIQFQPRSESMRAPHFVLYVKELLADKYGEKAVEEGGWKITTTLDWTKQEAAQNAITTYGESNQTRYNASNEALVSIDPNTGEILAMVGSRDFLNMDIDGQLNVTLRPRQPGSAIKPIVYSTAFEKGYGPATMLVDVSTDFGQGYQPRNYDGTFQGPISIREALANSINIPAVKTLAYAGVQDVIDTAHNMGITTLNDGPDRYGLSLTLGGGEVTLLDLTSAYGVLATGGLYAPPMAILKVEDKNGRVLEENTPPKLRRVLDPQVAYLVSNILSDDNARARIFGTGGPLNLPGRVVAAKTGTTNDFKDGWTLGYTPDLVAGVWAGNNHNESMTAASGLVATPTWHKYMQVALAGVPNKPFPRPEGIREVEVDTLSGKLPTDATPSTKMELFTSWGVPTEKDDVHKKVRVVVTAPDKLAPANFPQDLTEEMVFTEIHSERPNSPNWENPVIAWAKAHGYNSVPTEVYSGSAADIQTAIVMHQVSQSSFPITLTAHLTSYGQGLNGTKVEFYLDDALVGSIEDLSQALSIQVGSGKNGEHTAYVRLITSGGNISSSKVNFVTS